MSADDRDRRPLPIQLRERIFALIEDEGLRPGDRLPTEAVLAKHFGVGRTTAREALKLLEQDGIVDVRHGSGRFVSQVATLERPITRLESVTEMMRALGRTVVNRVESVTLRGATADESEMMHLPERHPVVELVRVRLHGDEALIYSVDVVPRDRVRESIDEVDWSGSLLEILDGNGARVISAMTQLRVVPLPEEARAAVGDMSGQPWILLIQRNIDRSGNVVIYSHDYHRYDSFSFSVFRQRA
jgi:GntR family transcriptional regulator